ncbi:MAG: trypsin-like peptidase domain-containing protein [Bacteroidota bacterium]
MSSEQELLELLDRYAKGTLRQDEATELENKIRNDPEFRKKAEEHRSLIVALKAYDHRRRLKHLLDSAHEEIGDSTETNVVRLAGAEQPSRWKKYAPMTAVAASVALVSILVTWFITRSLETQQSAYYKELRRNVEQIKKSQTRMAADIAESKEKTPTPGRYAGTGFLIAANGYVATSYHVIKGADSVFITNEKYGRLKALVVHNDPANDISILRIDADMLKGIRLPFTIFGQEANLGERVFTLGFPREDIVYGEGSVSAATGYQQNPNAYQISVPVNPGNSGGPLLNERGDLVGIISGVQTETSGAAFAIKSSVVLSVIDAVPDTLSRPLTIPQQSLLKNASRVQQVSRWKDFVFMVNVYNNQ